MESTAACGFSVQKMWELWKIKGKTDVENPECCVDKVVFNCTIQLFNFRFLAARWKMYRLLASCGGICRIVDLLPVLVFTDDLAVWVADFSTK